VVTAISVYVGGKVGERVCLIGRYGDNVRAGFPSFDSRQDHETCLFTILSCQYRLDAGPWHNDRCLKVVTPSRDEIKSATS
jgi:hypothetical protein